MDSNNPTSMYEEQAKRIKTLEVKLRIAKVALKISSTQRDEANAHLAAFGKDLAIALKAEGDAATARMSADDNRLELIGKYLKAVQENMGLKNHIRELEDDDNDEVETEEEDEEPNPFEFRPTESAQHGKKSTASGFTPQQILGPIATTTDEKAVDKKPTPRAFAFGEDPQVPANFEFGHLESLPQFLFFPSYFNPSIPHRSALHSTTAKKSSSDAFVNPATLGNTTNSSTSTLAELRSEGNTGAFEMGTLHQALTGQEEVEVGEGVTAEQVENAN